jgi:hypothetical protein
LSGANRRPAIAPAAAPLKRPMVNAKTVFDVELLMVFFLRVRANIINFGQKS